MVKMYGLGANGLNVTPEEFIERTYINEKLFYRLIDIMVIELYGNKPVIFARVSGHPPAPLSMSWNREKGPFKKLIGETIAQK